MKPRSLLCRLGLVLGDSRDDRVYQLPAAAKEAALDQYARDVARVNREEYGTQNCLRVALFIAKYGVQSSDPLFLLFHACTVYAWIFLCAYPRSLSISSVWGQKRYTDFNHLYQSKSTTPSMTAPVCWYTVIA